MHFTTGTAPVAALPLDGDHRHERGLAFLARAGEVLGRELPAGARLRRLARLLVPDLADVACVYVTGEHGELELVEAWALDPAHRSLVEARAARWAGAKDVPPVVARVLRGGRAEIVAEITEADLEAASHDPEDLEVLRRFGVSSWICAPISARGRPLGAISLLRASATEAAHARLHDTWDLALAEEVARRAAVAVENARLFETAQRERRRAEEALRLKDELLANLGHELRTPLTAILGWTRILRTRAVPDATRARALAVIERNALAQARLIEDLLDISLIVAGELSLEKGPVDLVSIVEAAVRAAGPAAEAGDLRLVARIGTAAARVTGDGGRLEQVVAHLLANAVKFTPAGGTIEVRLEQDGASAQVAVADTGQGIHADFLPHVFDRFRQADGSLTRAHGGLGVGLAIARTLVDLHDGTLEAHSAGEGQGATFTLRVPLTLDAPCHPR